MLRMAGQSNRLDEYNEIAGPNFLFPEGSDESLAGPSYRISGTEVLLETHCYNRHERDIGKAGDGEPWTSKWTKPVCYIKVAFKERAWVSAERLHIAEHGRMLHRYYHGVRVSFSNGGTFFFYDLNNLVSALTDMLVLLRVPKQIILIFMIYCLGSLSKI